jgi:prevent-host-death family protein
MARSHVVNVHEAKTTLSRLIHEATHGTDVVIAKAGTPLVKLVPVAATPPQRKPGYLRGQITIHDDFDSPLPDDLRKAFDGRVSRRR